jgi:hypothetical protein
MAARAPAAREARAMADELLSITCPRCGDEAQARYYGPCDRCRDDLRANHGSEARDVVAAAYEPKMNVTPNAVATKD